MPLQPLVRSPRPLQPLQLPPQLLAVVEDRDLPAQVKVTRVDLLQLLIPLTSVSLTVVEDVEISGRSGRTSG
jgi:hypothetical protein